MCDCEDDYVDSDECKDLETECTGSDEEGDICADTGPSCPKRPRYEEDDDNELACAKVKLISLRQMKDEIDEELSKSLAEIRCINEEIDEMQCKIERLLKQQARENKEKMEVKKRDC